MLSNVLGGIKWEITLKYHHRISEDFDFFTYPDVDFFIFQLQKKIEGIPAKIEHPLLEIKFFA
jgi:hypothetical protein